MFDKKINILKQAENGVGLITIEATVPTGFELVAKDECLKLFGPDTTIYDYRGSIFFNIPIKDYNKVSKLRCIDHLFLVGPYFENVEVFCKNNPNFENTDVIKQNDLKLIGELAEKGHMDTTLKAWREMINFKGNAFPTKEEHLNYKVAVENKTEDVDDTKKVLKFRATCYRSGSHTFSSMEAATVFGGKLQDNFHWVVDLSDFDLNVVLNISGS
uniref:Uncharacterized protein n=1 Tax=Clastoptera arizonana TaxID=38151 RepID=A0A1B6EAP2_9HEMI